MNRVHAFAIVLIAVLVVASAAALVAYTQSSNTKTPSAYVGVAFGGTTVQQAKILIDRVKDYTNLFILNAGRNALSRNQTAVTEICDYATSQGLSIIINLGVKTRETPSCSLRSSTAPKTTTATNSSASTTMTNRWEFPSTGIGKAFSVTAATHTKTHTFQL